MSFLPFLLALPLVSCSNSSSNNSPWLLDNGKVVCHVACNGSGNVGESVSIDYDQQARLCSFSDKEGFTRKYNFSGDTASVVDEYGEEYPLELFNANSDSRITSLIYGEGFWEYSYDSKGRMTNYEWFSMSSESSEPMSSYTLSWNDNGDLTSVKVKSYDSSYTWNIEYGDELNEFKTPLFGLAHSFIDLDVAFPIVTTHLPKSVSLRNGKTTYKVEYSFNPDGNIATESFSSKKGNITYSYSYRQF